MRFEPVPRAAAEKPNEPEVGSVKDAVSQETTILPVFAQDGQTS